MEGTNKNPIVPLGVDEKRQFKKLTILQELVLDGLITRLRSGEASGADFSNAIKMLKDNNVLVEKPLPDPADPSQFLQEDDTDLPFKE